MAALAEKKTAVVIFKKEKMLLNRTHKIAEVYEQICPRPRIWPLFFRHNFPFQLGQGHSLFFYFYDLIKQPEKSEGDNLNKGDLKLVNALAVLAEIIYLWYFFKKKRCY